MKCLLQSTTRETTFIMENNQKYYKFATIPLSIEEAQEQRNKEAQEIFDEINYLHNKAQDLRDKPLPTTERKLVDWNEGDPEEEKEWVASHLVNESERMGTLLESQIFDESPWLKAISKKHPPTQDNGE